MAEVDKVIEAIQAAKVNLSGTPSPDLDIYKYVTEIQKNAEFRYAPEERADRRQICARTPKIWKTLIVPICEPFTGFKGEQIRLFRALLNFAQFLFAGVEVTDKKR
jgi:hypothetical protein